MASQSKSIVCAAVGVLCLAVSAWGQFPEPITGFETDRDGNALLMQPASFNDLEVCIFQDPREADVTAANVVADIAATPPILPSTEESFTANFTADGFFGAGGSTQSLDIRFQWATPSNANRWVLVETLQSPIWGDPSLHLEGKVRMKINFPNITTEFPTLVYTQRVGVALLIRETGMNFPQGIQDTSAGDLEFVGVTSVANANTASPVPVPATFFDAPTTSGDGGWVSLEFDLDALELAGQVKGWTYYGGNGVLDATTNGDLVNRGVLAGLVLTVDSADTTSNYVEFLVDNLEFDAPVGDPTYAPRLGTPIIDGATSVRVNDVLSSSTNVALEIDRSDTNNEDPFVADQTYNVAPGGALYVNITVPALAIGDRLRARQTNPAPGGTSAYSIVIPVNPPAAFSLTLSLDEDGNLGVAPPDYEWVGASSVSGTAGTQGKPVFANCGQWQKVEFSLIPGVEPVIDFAGGNGSLVRTPPTGGFYNVDALFFTIDPTAPSTGPYSVWLDHVYIIDAADTEVVIASSESVNPFPSFRGQSTSTGNSSIISGLTSYDGRFSNRIQWSFPDLAASNTCAPYRPNVAFADTAKALGVWLLVEGEDCATTGPPRVTLPGPSYGNATAVRVTGLDAANVTSVKIYVDGALNTTLPVTGVTEVSVTVSPALSVGKTINATQTTAALGESAWSLPRPDIAPLAPTVAAGLVPGQTAVTVNNVLTEINGTASTVTVYVNEVSAGTAAGGTASVVVTVAALVNGDVVKATQTVNGVESPKSAGVTVAVPAPVVETPLNANDTQVTVSGLHPTATTATVYVNANTYPVATLGAASVIVTVPALQAGDTVRAKQTIAGVEGPFSNAVVIANFVRINEFNYDDMGAPDSHQFIELYNSGTSPTNISGWVIEVGDVGVYYTYTIPAATTIAAGGFWVVGQTAVSTVPGAVVNAINDALNLGDSGWGGTGNAVNGEMYIALRNPSLVMLDAVATEMNKRITPGPAPATPDIVAQIGVGIWGNHVNTDTPASDFTSQSRFLNGLDTDNNGRDWGISKASPGFSNNQPDLMPYSENANALVPPAAVPNWVYSYVAMRAKDPTVADTVNPAAIPASPDGGNVMIEWDQSGGGSCAYLSQLAKEDFTLETYIYIPPTYSPVGLGYEDARIGIRGSADGVINLGDPGGMTGLEWFWQRGESWQILYLLDENDGDDTGLPGYSYARMIGSIAIAQNDPLTTGWQRLLLESQGDKVRGIFGGTYGSRGDGIKKSGTHQSTGPGSVYVGYRETMTGTGVPNNRPPTLDAITLKAPPVFGDMDGDLDVDLADVAKFVNCMNGPNVSTPPVGCTLNEFGLADLGWDNDVDMVDFAEFQKLF